MSYTEHLPAPALRAFVDRFWSATPSAANEPVRVLPDGCIDVLLDPARGRAHVVGAMTAPALGSGEAAWVAVRFRPAGAAPFLRLSACTLTDREVDVRDLQVPWLHKWVQQSGGLAQGAALSALQSALLRHVPAERPHALAAHAARALFAERAPRVEALAASLGCSRQHLARVFQQHVGVTPKTLARVGRVHRALDAMQRAPRRRLADVAVDTGYFDEAHLDADFRALVGLPPREARGSVFPMRSLIEGA